ncbi:anthranilate synthase, component I [Methanothermus fervidus DSM 2088]|uniref:Anthranilate synthase component 1 n=1 Tax=Methanothermus fervidus (strain ATCC 43054 / DSM 2088 / JCM 10308 / V24 S) TaxID=523846 RepID=E3GX13_METFV|nr:anthranilate synthase, component I [Methanothermus fervidus DSM 2088]
MNVKVKNPKIIKLKYRDPFKVFERIYEEYENCFLLESKGESDSSLSRYSFIGFDPKYIIRSYGKSVEIDDGSIEKFRTNNPFNDIKKILKSNFNGHIFSGGLVGYVSYPAARFFLPLDLKRGSFPDYEFGLFLDSIIFNHLNKKCYYVTINDNRIEEVKKIINEEPTHDRFSFKNKGKFYSKKEFEDMVRKVKHKIKKGEIFQGVISNAYEYELKGSKIEFYKILRKINPSPYMYHLKFKKREIIGSSPEMLVRIENNKIKTFPIAGTRPRGRNSKEDKKLEKELLNDEKELAEHLMLVDLARNDVGMVSEIGTVKVPEFMIVKKFSHVQHIVSKVVGKLSKDKTAVDAFLSMFPAGTVSGAPKIRAMEIIEEIEKKPRDVYAGAVGYFSLNGNADFAIAIRTLISQNSYGRIQAGAGIVHDSIPENEYLECENKARALIDSLHLVENHDTNNR